MCGYRLGATFTRSTSSDIPRMSMLVAKFQRS